MNDERRRQSPAFRHGVSVWHSRRGVSISRRLRIGGCEGGVNPSIRQFEFVLEWLRFADDDLMTAQVMEAHHPKPLEIICFHC